MQFRRDKIKTEKLSRMLLTIPDIGGETETTPPNY